ncbi:MAG: hypothetical protein ACRDL7_01570, partial [Gaiellaceae bacterium]
SRKVESLPALYVDYVENILKIPRHHPNFNVSNLVERAIKFKRSESTREQINSFLEECRRIDESLAKKLSAAISNHINGLFAAVRVEASLLGEEGPSNALIPTAVDEGITTPTPQERPAKRKRGGSNDLPARKLLSKVANHDKLSLVVDINSDTPSDMSELTEAARNIYITSIKPICHCLEFHFGNDRDQFNESWSKIQFKHSKFKTTFCPGPLSRCVLSSGL